MIHSNTTLSKTALLFLVTLLLLAEIPAMAAQKKKGKKPTGTMVGPTGILGKFQPKWPKKPTEIQVSHIEDGSPASGTTLKVGDTIVGFGKEKFKRHPFWDASVAIEKAEAAGGELALLLKSGKQAVIKLAPLGAYSATAPYKCPKTDKIITQAADALVKAGAGGGATQTGLLGLMATGEQKYIDVVAEKIQGLAKVDPQKVDAYLKGENNEFGSTGWIWGYNLIALGEYYLLTKDEKVLPAIRTYALGLARGQDGLGLWGHRVARGPKWRAPGYGVMNQPSLSNLMGMLIAKKCGINDPVLEKAIAKTYTCTSYVAGRGGFAYGSGLVYPGYFNNNGTSGSAAIILSLQGNQEGAKFFSQNAATSYDSLTSGHASSFFNPLWTPLGTSLSGPKVTQQFFKRTLWYFTNERHWKGGFPRKSSAGAVAGQALLTYCIPRKALLITGREADPSIYVKDAEVSRVILRSKTDYKKKSVEELCALLDDVIQVRLKARGELARRAGKGKDDDKVTPKMLAMLKEGNDKTKIKVISYLGVCHPTVAEKHIGLLGQILRSKSESFKVRVATATTLGGKAFGKAALPYYSDILKLVLEKRPEADPLEQVDNALSKVLMAISGASKLNALEMEPPIDRELLYKVANRFLDHKRQNVRAAGGALVIGIPKEDFHLIAEKLLYVLKNEDPTYHSYSNAVNVPGITILAENNIKEGLDLLVHAIYHGGGKWAFRYRGLMKVLPLYGKNAEPYIEKFEAHKNINKKGDRFTPAWQKVVKAIREDKNPGKLISIEEAIQTGKKE